MEDATANTGPLLLESKSTLLRGTALWKSLENRPHDIPQRGGLKEFAPDGSWLQAKRLQKMHEERREMLSEERIEKQDNLAEGVWLPKYGLIQLKKEEKFWRFMGHVDKGNLYLFPEEALYLMEVGSLEVWYGGLPLSIQQAYSTFLGNEVSLDEYQVYAHLMRLGYVVFRHIGPSNITEYERKIRLDQYVKDISYSKQLTISPKKRTSNEETGIGVPQSKKFRFCSESDSGTDISDSEYIIDSLDTSDQNESSKTKLNDSYKDPEAISFASTSKLADEQHSKGEPLHLQTMQTEIKPDCKNENEEISTFKELEESVKIARSWGDYKKGIAKLEANYKLECGPAAVLWEGDVKPLVKPEDAHNTEELLKSLQIIEPNQLTKAENSPLIGTGLKISFDAYLPDAKFKKSQPGLPNHRICVMKFTDPAPNLDLISHMIQQCRDGVPLHWAVVDNGDITFYIFDEIHLPMDITLG